MKRGAEVKGGGSKGRMVRQGDARSGSRRSNLDVGPTVFEGNGQRSLITGYIESLNKHTRPWHLSLKECAGNKTEEKKEVLSTQRVTILDEVDICLLSHDSAGKTDVLPYICSDRVSDFFSLTGKLCIMNKRGKGRRTRARIFEIDLKRPVENRNRYQRGT